MQEKQFTKQFAKQLRDEIIEITERLRNHEKLFDLVDDEDLIEAIIYEQKALHLRYNHLIKTAKAKSIHMDFIEREERRILKQC